MPRANSTVPDTADIVKLSNRQRGIMVRENQTSGQQKMQSREHGNMPTGTAGRINVISAGCGLSELMLLLVCMVYPIRNLFLL